jgi:hypothetical protein
MPVAITHVKENRKKTRRKKLFFCGHDDHVGYIFLRLYNEESCVTSGAGSAYPSRAPAFTPGFSGVRVTRSLVLCVMFFRLLFVLFVLFLLAIVLSVLLRYTYSDYPFGIFKIHLISSNAVVSVFNHKLNFGYL